VAVYMMQTRSSLTIRRLRDVPHVVSDGKCIDCVADAADEVSTFVRTTEAQLTAARSALAAVREVRATTAAQQVADMRAVADQAACEGGAE
jgi:hypothetical protein